MTVAERNWILAGITVLALIIVGVYFEHGGRSPAGEANPLATTTPQYPGASITGSGYTIRELPAGEAPKAPDYGAPFVFSTSASPEVRAAVNGQAATLRARLKADPRDFSSWVSLGTLYDVAGDYKNAEALWTYASLVWPTNTVTFNNLGGLYTDFLKDYPKAAANYLQAIANDPHDTDAYRNLFTLYTGPYKTTPTAAEDILKKGIQSNPDTLDFYVLLARYYRDSGRTADARAEYDAAIALADKQGNTSISASLKAELAALK